MVKRVGKYELGKTLGEGTFGKVKMARNIETNEYVAIKILEKERIQKQNMGSQIKKEISIMKLVRHKNVVNLIEVLASRTKIFIVIELITGGELFEKIIKAGRLSEEEARFYFIQLVEGVQYCHQQGVCHRDLKPENLLLDDKLNLKISDFGLSALHNSEEGENTSLLHTTCGTPNYVAPEVLLDKGYDGRIADIWSMGVILFVLLSGYLPFDEPNMTDLFRKIQKAEYKFPNWFSNGAKALIRKILDPVPSTRITIPQILADPWLNKSKINPVSPPVTSVIPTGEQVKSAISDVNEGSEAIQDSIETITAFDIVNTLTTNSLNKMMTSNFTTPKNISV